MNRGLGFGFGLISSSNIAGDPAVATLTPTELVSATTGNGITDIPINASSATEGYLMVLLVTIWASTSITDYPAGWNLARTGKEGTSSGQSQLYAFSKIASSSESTSYTFTVSGNLYGDRFTYSLLEIPRTGLGVRNATYSSDATLGKLYGYTTNTLHLALCGKADYSATEDVVHPTNYTELLDRTGSLHNHAIAYKEISGSAPEYDTYAEGAVSNGSSIPSFNIDIGSGGNAAVIVSVRSESGTAAATPAADITVTVGGTAAPLISGATGSEQGLATNHLFGLAMGSATGNQAVVVSWTSGNAHNHAVASSFTGVDQTTPFDNGTGQGVAYAATSDTLAITSATGDLTFSDFGEKGGVYETVTVNTTQRYNLLNGDGRAVGSTAAGAASVNHIATISTGSGRAVHVGCNIRGVSLADSVSSGSDEFTDPDNDNTTGDNNLSNIHLAISNEGSIISENYEGTGTPVGFTTTTDGSGTITFDETTTVLEGSKSLKVYNDNSATDDTYTYVDLNQEYDHIVAIFGYNITGMSNRTDVHFLDDELSFGSNSCLAFGSVSSYTKGIKHDYNAISLTMTGTINNFHYVRVEINHSGGVLKIARSNDKTFPTSGDNYAEDTSASFNANFSGTRAIAFGTSNKSLTTYYDDLEVTGEIGKATTITDDFNRSDTVLEDVATAEGWSWVNGRSDPDTMSVVSNKARVTNSNDYTEYYADYSLGTDVEVQVTVTNEWPSNTSGSNVSARWTDRDNRYRVHRREDQGDWRLYKVVAGTETELGTRYSASPTPPYTMKLVCNGDQISVYIDDVLRIGPVTDTSITSGDYVAIGGYNNGANRIEMDDFIASAL